jgi:hypothetical protein
MPGWPSQLSASGIQSPYIHRANGLLQIAVSTPLRANNLDTANFCQRSAVDTALEIYHLSRTVNRFRGLLEAGGDGEADDDVGDVDDEVAPGIGRGVGRGSWSMHGSVRWDSS